MKIRLSILLAAALLCVSLVSSGEDKKSGKPVKGVELSKDSILIGDQVALKAKFSVPSDALLQVSPYSQALAQDTTFNGGVEIVREFVLDTISIKNGISELSANVLLTSFDSGSYKLPKPIIITAGKDGGIDTLNLEESLLYVNTIQIDTASFKPFDIKGQEKYPITFKDVLPWILILLAVAVVVWGVLRYIKMRRQQKDFFGKSLVKEPAHIVALKKLDKLRTEKLWQGGKEKAYYTGITDVLREYIETRYGFGAMEKTSAEIIEALGDKKLDTKIYTSLDEMLRTADLVKFAKYTPSADENENAIPVAVNFVNFAYMQQLEAQESVGTSAGKSAENAQVNYSEKGSERRSENGSETIGNNKNEEAK